jgi:hypothetical protein
MTVLELITLLAKEDLRDEIEMYTFSTKDGFWSSHPIESVGHEGYNDKLKIIAEG